MLNRFYSNMHRVVAKHCQHGGIDGMFRKSEQVYDTSTGNNSELYNDYTFKALEFDYQRYNSGETTIQGTLVERADKQYLVDPLSILDSTGKQVWPAILPEKGDIVIVEGLVSSVVLIKEISPNRENPVMIEIQTKR
jgi:hypothetical protein